MVAEDDAGRTVESSESSGRRREWTMSAWPGGTVTERVIVALAEVRPALMADGGNVELVEVRDDEVLLRLTGACRSCPMAPSTLVDFVAERIKLYAPEIERVLRVD